MRKILATTTSAFLFLCSASAMASMSEDEGSPPSRISMNNSAWDPNTSANKKLLARYDGLQKELEGKMRSRERKEKESQLKKAKENLIAAGWVEKAKEEKKAPSDDEMMRQEQARILELAAKNKKLEEEVKRLSEQSGSERDDKPGNLKESLDNVHLVQSDQEDEHDDPADIEEAMLLAVQPKQPETDEEEIRKAVVAAARSTKEIGLWQTAKNATVNTVTRAWKSEEDRYDPSVLPVWKYSTLLTLFQTKWFPKKNPTELGQLTLKDFHCNLTPIHYKTSQYDGGYIFVAGLDCGEFSVDVSDPTIETLLELDKCKTQNEKSLKVFNSYVDAQKKARKKSDMKAFTATYDDSQGVKYPYEFLKRLRKFLKIDGDNTRAFRDIQYCRRPNHNNHTYSLITMRWFAFDTEKNVPIHFTIYGSKVDHKLEAGDVISIQRLLLSTYKDDWLAKG